MANPDLKKNIAIGIATLAGVTVFGLWSFGVIGGDSGKSDSALKVPDGYSHVNSQQQGNEIVHTYQKTPPQTAGVSQTPDQAYARYMQTLPDSLDKAIAQEFRTLSVSLQNARLFADTTGLIRQGKENMKTLGELEGKQQAQAKEQALNKNNTGLLVGGDIQPSVVNENPKSTASKGGLDDVILEGVVGGDDGYYAMLKDSEGRPFTLKPGQRFEGDLVVKSVDTKEVVITDGQQERVIPVM